VLFRLARVSLLLTMPIAISVVLVSPTFRRMLNDGAVSLALIPVLAFVAGTLYAAAVFWLGGGLLYGASRRLGSEGTWLRSRHVLGLAAAPLALSLLTFWPLREVVEELAGTDDSDSPEEAQAKLARLRPRGGRQGHGGGARGRGPRVVRRGGLPDGDRMGSAEAPRGRGRSAAAGGALRGHPLG